MLIGKRLNDRYKILQVIGGGGMANVYLARDMILERDVAIKVLRLDFANDESFIKRFHREAQSATSIAHPNIVSIYDVGEEEGIYYIVMEYVAGYTLKQYIQQQAPLPIEKAVNIMMQITSAIAHAHQYGIVHRDLKPQNILIDDHETAKVTDFGIAIALSSTTITHTNSVLGSVHYLSPEQARGGLANKKSDVYSLGIVLFELLTGRVPFSGESAVSIALKHLQTDTPSPKRWNPAIPQSIENVVLKATAKDPFYRYESVEEMEEDLRTALEPDRMSEAKFSIPDDDEVTKAIPIITDDYLDSESNHTIVRPSATEDLKKETKESKESTKEVSPTSKKKKSKLVPTLIFIILLLAAGSIAAVTFIPSLLLPKDITIPELQNEEYERAVTQVLSLGLKVEDTQVIYDNSIEEGKVIRTDPSAGEVVKEGSPITIYRSAGKEKVVFDRYIGRNAEDIKKLLEERNYKEVRTVPVESEETPGTIVDQVPKETEEVIPEQTTVTLWVSTGPPDIILKDFSGWTEKSVNDYLSEYGLEVVSEKEYSDTVGEGLVISQSPKSNETVQKGDTVTITVSQGQEEKPPKTVTRTVTIPYEPIIEGQPQQVKIYVEDLQYDVTVPYKEWAITETVTEEIQLTISPGGQAKYQVVRDESIIEEQVIDYEDES
ncbi:Stk1 family PASTA domain-containing Ser/Thr kinase [Bacillus sp. CGMCC 1.16541]|uniref:Stk1 family PASTA domain-containing Ser/Thr kinase n=1 Tax=Bacillus sp. CGMCC 1.16541 TaxID=2185143 RepID=UPI000D73D5DD|nr:Stk1 family PASTA domain-containing Ser/Thr kinase [Bacillus sp. CGMCC 1.16541]